MKSTSGSIRIKGFRQCEMLELLSMYLLATLLPPSIFSFLLTVLPFPPLVSFFNSSFHAVLPGMPFNWTDVGRQHWIPSHWQGFSCKRVLPEMADPVSHLIECICFFCFPCGHPECKREQVLLYLPANGGILSSSSWMAHSTFGAIKERGTAHKGSRMLFRSMEKDLAHRSLQPSTALAGPSPLGGDRKVTFDIILS